jgi:hypothetical protein
VYLIGSGNKRFTKIIIDLAKQDTAVDQKHKQYRENIYFTSLEMKETLRSFFEEKEMPGLVG